MKDLGQAKQILAMRISCENKNDKLWLSQLRYIEKILERFNINKSKPINTPLVDPFKLSSQQCPSSEIEKEEMSMIIYASKVDNLMYAIVCIKPNIAYGISVVSKFLSNSNKEHQQVVKWICRYLRSTFNVCLYYCTDKLVLDGYIDVYLVGDVNFRKSTFEYMITFLGEVMSWQTTKKVARMYCIVFHKI